jgi:hypothetical protein
MPKVAAALCVLFVLYLIYTDLKRPDSPSKELWVPIAWMFLAGSRYVSAWLNLSPQFQSAQDLAEGSPLDRAVFSALILAGVFILIRRKIDWGRFLVRNWWLLLYFLYTLSSAAWADDPALLAKRWVKDLGNPIMAMVILTEKRPYEAVGVVLRRLAFIMLPLSVLFVKYYPDLGRWYRHDGAQTFIGIGTQKNDLGLMCLLAGIYMAWDLLQRRKNTLPSYIQEHRTLSALMVGMMGWLLYKSNSQTSLVCLVAAVGVLMLGRPAFMTEKPNRIFAALTIGGLSVWLLDDALELKETALYLLGREPHLTTRTDVWDTVLSFNTNPMYGVGFMSFWTGSRLEDVWKQLGVQLNQAHNGYLEQYLNLGYIGVLFIGVMMMSALHKAKRHMTVDPAAGMMRLCFVAVAGLYNYTEASFYGSNNMWMLLLLAYFDVPRQTQRRTLDHKPRKLLARVRTRSRPLVPTYSR